MDDRRISWCRTALRTMALAVACVVALASVAAAGQDHPVVEPVLGHHTVSFKDRSKWSVLGFQGKRFGYRIDPKSDYDLVRESYSVYVPPKYGHDKPYGLFVWICSNDSGKLPAMWKRVIEKHKLIWIGANEAGNQRMVVHRIGLALDAVHNMKKLYSIDEQRIYVSGVSGGGRASSMVAPAYPDVFSGGYYLIGCNYFRRIDVPDAENRFWKPSQIPPMGKLMQLATRKCRYVLLTGEKDFNRVQMKLTYEKGYLKDKFRHVTYLEVPRMGHRLPNAEWFEKGIKALDSPVAEARRAPTPDEVERRSRQLLNLARNYINAKKPGLARSFLAKIVKDCPNTTGALEAAKLLKQIGGK